MAINFGENISSYGGTGGGDERYWREGGEGGGWWDYRQKPMDYSNVDFGTPPIPGASPLVDNSGTFTGWRTPDGMLWAPNGQFTGQGAQSSYGDWTGGMPGSVPGSNSVPPWLKYSVLGSLAAMGGYGALVAAPALAAGAAGGAGAGAGAGLAAGEGAMLGGGIAPLTYGGVGGMAGGVGTTAAGVGAGAGSSLWGTGANGAWGLNPGMTGGTGMAPSASSWWQNPSVLKGAAGVLGSGSGSSGQQGQGSSLGSVAGGLLGAGLGYLDAANQPNEYTVRTEIDPALKAAYYGQGGLFPTAMGIYNQQQSQPNYLAQAGQQISGMANTLPSYNEAVTNNKSLWDSNPWVQQQQQAITDLATRNLNENVLPGIGSEANAAGGYGGSRQGIAQGLAMSRLNQDLAPSLTGLASNAFENSQNRALQGAGTQLNYGLSNQLQQAGLLGTGASMQQSAPWANFNQLSSFARNLPGGQSTTNPIFNNTTTAALGGGSLGSQIGGNIDWGKLFGGIGDWFK